MEAEGPAALEPAQATQFSHPLILWIWLFTVCADEGTQAKTNSAITRMERFLIVFFTITNFYSRGFFAFHRALCRDLLEITDASTLEQPFFTCARENSKSRISR
jgi:hypothetical protein